MLIKNWFFISDENDALEISPLLKGAFVYPNKEKIKKKKKNVKVRSTTPGYVVDDIVNELQKQEDIKKMKTEQVLLNKQNREKAKEIRMKEQNIIKSFQNTKKKLTDQKKSINLEIKNIKQLMKSESAKENKIQLEERLKKFSTELEEVEKALLLHEMEALQTKMKIKQEKI